MSELEPMIIRTRTDDSRVLPQIWDHFETTPAGKVLQFSNHVVTPSWFSWPHFCCTSVALLLHCRARDECLQMSDFVSRLSFCMHPRHKGCGGKLGQASLVGQARTHRVLLRYYWSITGVLLVSFFTRAPDIRRSTCWKTCGNWATPDALHVIISRWSKTCAHLASTRRERRYY